MTPVKPSPEIKKDLPSILYAKTNSIEVTKEKDPTSDVVQTLNRADVVRVIERSGSRYQVKLPKGKTGWVSKLRLSEQKPSAKPKGLADLAKIKTKHPPTVKESKSGGSIRG